MGKRKKETMEFRFYEVPQGEAVLALLGDSWIRRYGHDGSVHLHFHNLMEIGYCIDGTGELYLNEERHRYEPSMFSVIPANYPHITVSDGEDTNFWEYIFFDPAQVVCELYPDNPICQRHMTEMVNRNALLLKEEENVILLEMIRLVMEEMRGKRPHYTSMVKSMVRGIVIELIRLNEKRLKMESGIKSEPDDATKSNQITAALEYVSEHYAEPVQVCELAEACSMSETHFRRLFKKNMNMSPMDYVNLIRIQKACDLMKRSDDSMDTVAMKCGFATTSTFDRNFKKYLSTSPYQWKINPENYERKILDFKISALKGW